MLELLAVAGAEHAEPTAFGLPFLSPGGVVAISMIVVILIALRAGVPRLVAKALDERIAGIRQQLDEATQLRAEAQALRDDYANKAKQADKDIAALKLAAETQAADIIDKAKAGAAALIERHKVLAADKIAAAERTAIAELRAKAAEAAAAAAKGLIAEGHGPEADRKLVDKAISGI